MVELDTKERALARRHIRQWREAGETWRDIASRLSVKHPQIIKLHSGKGGWGSKMRDAFAKLLFGGSVDQLRDRARLEWEQTGGMRFHGLVGALRMRGEEEWLPDTVEYAALLDGTWPCDRSAAQWFKELEAFDTAARHMATTGDDVERSTVRSKPSKTREKVV